MEDLGRDPIVNVIQNGIKRGIRVALESECYGAVVVLVYSGLDTMAYLDMPPDQDDVTRKDFVEWAEKYIRFPCEKQVSGLDLYGARCGVLHTHGAFSRLNREGKCRVIGYADRMVPEVVYQPSVSEGLVMVSIDGLVRAFFDGMDEFLVHLFANPTKAKAAERRFRRINHTIPYEPNQTADPPRGNGPE